MKGAGLCMGRSYYHTKGGCICSFCVVLCRLLDRLQQLRASSAAEAASLQHQLNTWQTKCRDLEANISDLEVQITAGARAQQELQEERRKLEQRLGNSCAELAQVCVSGGRQLPKHCVLAGATQMRESVRARVHA